MSVLHTDSEITSETPAAGPGAMTETAGNARERPPSASAWWSRAV